MRAVVQWMGMGVVGVSGGADRAVVQWMGMGCMGEQIWENMKVTLAFLAKCGPKGGTAPVLKCSELG